MNRKSGHGLVTLVYPSVKNLENEEMQYFYVGDISVDFHGMIGEPIVRIKNVKGVGEEIWIPIKNISSIVWDNFQKLSEFSKAGILESRGQMEAAKPQSPSGSER